MRIFNSIEEFSKINRPTSLTIGSFDGVHKGHQKVLKQLKDISKQNHTQSVVITFSPHPRIFFHPENNDFKLLNTDFEKSQLLENQGIDYLIIQPFDKKFAEQTPVSFIQKLVENLHMNHLLMGYDHRFGKDKKGDFDMIKPLANKYGFQLHQIDALKMNDLELSSTRIRNELKNGKIEKANELLGYPYFITGQVIKGNQLGRKLGYPTANIEVTMPDDQSRKQEVGSRELVTGSIKSENIDSSIHLFIDSSTKYKLIPKQGVYLVKSNIDGKDYYGMMNIGFRPTIDGKKQIKEVHFFDLDKDLYGKNLQISFLKRLRNEQKFPSLEALQKQLQRDEIQARSLIPDYT